MFDSGLPDLKAACDRNPCIDLVLTRYAVMLAISVKLVSTLEIPILVGMESSFFRLVVHQGQGSVTFFVIFVHQTKKYNQLFSP